MVTTLQFEKIIVQQTDINDDGNFIALQVETTHAIQPHKNTSTPANMCVRSEKVTMEATFSDTRTLTFLECVIVSSFNLKSSLREREREHRKLIPGFMP